MQAEFDSQKVNKSSKLTNSSEDQTELFSYWIYKTLYSSKVRIERYNIHSVVKSVTKIEDINNNETFAIVVISVI